MKTIIILVAGIAIAVVLSQISAVTTLAFILVAGALFAIGKRLGA